MSVSILEALENADYNLENNGLIGLSIARKQLRNAVTLLSKGYGIYEEVEPLIEQHGNVEAVPDKSE